MAFEIGIILLLILANGVFAGAEIAIVSVRKTRLHQLVRLGSESARAVERLRASPETFLATVQIGISVVGATAAAFGGSTLTARVIPLLEGIPLVAPYASRIALALVVAMVSYFSLILGELVPKSLALRTSESYALTIGRPLLGLSWLVRPLVSLMTASSNTVLRLFGDRTSFTESRLSADELRQMVEEAARSGSLDPHAGDIAVRAIAFERLRAVDVMVPRRVVDAVSRDLPQAELLAHLAGSGHARVPVFEGSLDRVVGFVSVREALRFAVRGETIPLAELVRPVYFAPETMRAVELLRELQQRHLHLAAIVDEAGSLSGIVTMEDLVEELVGDIFSEHDDAVPLRIRADGEGVWLVDGGTPIRDANREIGLRIPENEGVTTIAGWCLRLSGRIPETGAILVQEDGTRFEISEASPRRVRTVRVRAAKGTSRPG